MKNSIAGSFLLLSGLAAAVAGWIGGRDWVAALCLLVGAGLSLVAAWGAVKLPDLYTRMQAAAKAATLGVAFSVLSVAIHFGEPGVTAGVSLVIVFFFLTAPVAAHMIARAAYQVGVPLWEGTTVDEWRHQLQSPDAPKPSPRPSPREQDAPDT